MPKVQAPEVTFSEGPVGGETHKHPAFGEIQASRVTGGRNYLFGSDFHHSSVVRLSISPCQYRRDLSHDWYLGTHPSHIEVDLSESQWAQFVSSLNHQGTPCTVRLLGGVEIPGIPVPATKVDTFSSEMTERLSGALQSARKVMLKIQDSKLSAKAKEEILRDLEGVSTEIKNNVEFVAESFSKHMESEVDKAKTEVNAYVGNAINRAGLQALQSKTTEGAFSLGFTPEGDPDDGDI